MALIQCPECGKEISDKATTCPHCGTPIFVCPECGQVAVGNIELCPQCGYMNKVKTPVSQIKEIEIDAEDDKKTDPVESWLNANPKEKKWFNNNFTGVLKLLVLAGSVGLFLCIYFFIQKPVETLKEGGYEAVEMIFNYKTYIRNVWILAIIICLLFFVLTLLESYKTVWSTRFGRWLIAQKYDVKEL